MKKLILFIFLVLLSQIAHASIGNLTFNYTIDDAYMNDGGCSPTSFVFAPNGLSPLNVCAGFNDKYDDNVQATLTYSPGVLELWHTIELNGEFVPTDGYAIARVTDAQSLTQHIMIDIVYEDTTTQRVLSWVMRSNLGREDQTFILDDDLNDNVFLSGDWFQEITTNKPIDRIEFYGDASWSGDPSGYILDYFHIDLVDGCNEYTSGEYGVGDTITTDSIITDLDNEFSFYLDWDRVKYTNGTYINQYDDISTNLSCNYAYGEVSEPVDWDLATKIVNTPISNKIFLEGDVGVELDLNIYDYSFSNSAPYWMDDDRWNFYDDVNVTEDNLVIEFKTDEIVSCAMTNRDEPYNDMLTGGYYNETNTTTTHSMTLLNRVLDLEENNIYIACNFSDAGPTAQASKTILKQYRYSPKGYLRIDDICDGSDCDGLNVRILNPGEGVWFENSTYEHQIDIEKIVDGLYVTYLPGDYLSFYEKLLHTTPYNVSARFGSAANNGIGIQIRTLNYPNSTGTIFNNGDQAHIVSSFRPSFYINATLTNLSLFSIYDHKIIGVFEDSSHNYDTNFDKIPTVSSVENFFDYKSKNSNLSCVMSDNIGNYEDIVLTDDYRSCVALSSVYRCPFDLLTLGSNTKYISCRNSTHTEDSGVYTYKLNIIKENNAPYIEELYLDDTTYYFFENISLNYELFDIDTADGNEQLQLIYEIYINDGLYKSDTIENITSINEQSELILYSNETDVNDEIYVRARVYDGEEYTDWEQTDESYILDYSIPPPDYFEPTIFDVLIFGNTANENLSGYCAGESYYSKVSYNYEWFVNNVSVYSNTTPLVNSNVFTSVGTLLNSNYTRFDEVTLSCKVVDYTSQSNFTNKTITIENSIPTIISTDPFENQAIAFRDYNFSVIAADIDSDELTYIHKLNGAIVGSSDANFTYSNLQDKTEYEWNITINDGYSNTSYIIPFYVSLQSPAITFISPRNSWYNELQNNITIEFSAFDPNSTSYCELYVDGGLNQTINSIVDGQEYNFTINGTEDQTEYIYNIYCEDSLGFGDDYPRNFTTGIDTIAPDLFVFSPANGTYNRQDIPVTIETTDNFPDVCSYNIYYAFADILKEGGTIDCDYASSLDVAYYRGGYRLELLARDKANNIDSESVLFYALPESERPLVVDDTDDGGATTGGGGGGGGGGSPAIDFATFSIQPTVFKLRMSPGQERLIEFEIKNEYISPLDFVIEIDEDSQISDWLTMRQGNTEVDSFRVEISNEGGLDANTRFVGVYIDVPENIAIDTYDGTIAITANGETQYVTIEANIGEGLVFDFLSWLNFSVFGFVTVWMIWVLAIISYIGIRWLYR